MRAARRASAGAVALVAALTIAVPARAAPEDFDGASVIFARGSSLFRIDARGGAETEIAQLAAKMSVRALRTDAAGSVLLVDLAGKWAWMPLDGSTRWLTDLPCGDGPAQLAEDGGSVLCRSATAGNQAILVELPRTSRLKPGKTVAIDVPAAGARISGDGAERRLVWPDAGGVWMAPPGDPKSKVRVAPDPPLRGFLPSPDGGHAIGVYADQVYTDVRHTKPAEVLMTVQLDQQGARRKAIRDGVAVEWSHDSQWVLVQDGASACIMRATGGQYKCWRGYTAASLSSDGRWGLVLGNRDGSRRQTPQKSKSKASAGQRAKPAARPSRPPSPFSSPGPAGSSAPAGPGDKPWDHIDEPSDEPEAGEAPESLEDVSVAPPTGPLSLFRVRLEGAFTDRPVLLAKVVDGAAVWVPQAP
jgi:hypothetical protein